MGAQKTVEALLAAAGLGVSIDSRIIRTDHVEAIISPFGLFRRVP